MGDEHLPGAGYPYRLRHKKENGKRDHQTIRDHSADEGETVNTAAVVLVLHQSDIQCREKLFNDDDLAADEP